MPKVLGDWLMEENDKLRAELAAANERSKANYGRWMRSEEEAEARETVLRAEIAAIKEERDALRVGRGGMLESNWLIAFHNADAATAEEHARQFMETNFAEAIHIARDINWRMIQDALTEAFKVAEARAIAKQSRRIRDAVVEECAKVADNVHCQSCGLPKRTAAAIRALAKE